MSTNPMYEGNDEGVVAHLSNTIALIANNVFSRGAYSTQGRPVSTIQNELRAELSEGIAQRWHLTPASSYTGVNLANSSYIEDLESDNEKLRASLQSLLDLRDEGIVLRELDEQGVTLASEIFEAEQELVVLHDSLTRLAEDYNERSVSFTSRLNAAVEEAQEVVLNT